MEMTRKEFLAGAAASVGALGATAAGTHFWLPRKDSLRLGINPEEKEEEMYKELLQLVMERNLHATTLEVFHDDVSVSLGEYSLYGVKCNTYVGGKVEVINRAFRDSCPVRYVDLPLCVDVQDFSFLRNATIKRINLPKCSHVGTRVLEGTTALDEVFMGSLTHTQQGFPFGSTNPNTVFHMSDGDYDYQGNPVLA